MHFELLDCKGVKFDRAFIKDYEKVFTQFLLTFKDIKKEEQKREGFKILR